jgi:hypothetical protein
MVSLRQSYGSGWSKDLDYGQLVCLRVELYHLLNPNLFQAS